jgi:hypothetical protein
MAVIAFILMLPNIIGSIGGAEKVGWSTSYHSYYQPALMLAALFGYRRLYHLACFRNIQWSAAVPILGAFIFYLCLLSPIDTRPIRFGVASFRYHFLPTFLSDRAKYFGDTADVMASAADQLRRTVPEHAVVTTIEAGMPMLYKHHTIRVFPFDFERSDYALMTYEETPKGTRYFGAPAFLKPIGQKKVDAIISRRMRAAGYDFEHVRKFPIFTLALVKRSMPSQVSKGGI